MKTTIEQIKEASETYNSKDFMRWFTKHVEGLILTEKEELKEAYIAGSWDTSGLTNSDAFEIYYKETYGE